MRAKFVFEQFDDPDLQKRVSKHFPKDVLKDLVKNEPHKTRYETGSYHGKDSGDLNNLVNQAMTKRGKYVETDAQGTNEVIYRLLTKEIPFLKDWKVKAGGSIGDNPVHHLNIQKEIPIPDPNDELDRPFQAEANIWVTFFAVDDEILEEDEGKLKLLLSLQVRGQEKGGLMWDIGKDSKKWRARETKFKPKKGECDGEDCGVDFEEAHNEEELDNLMNKMQDIMYGQPDEQDTKISKEVAISERNISLEELNEIIPEIKTSIEYYNNFLKAKYDIALI